MTDEQSTEVAVPSRAQREINALSTGNKIAPIVPTTVEEAFRLAQAIVGAGLAPASYEVGGGNRTPDPQKIMIGILKGAEVGLPPITALSTIAIINKRPCIWGDGAVALVQQSGKVDKVEQRWEGTESEDDWTAIYRIWRKGQDEPYEGRFSVADAKRAHLWKNTKKTPWIEYPQRMLLARARAYALRDGFADCLAGLSIAEEVQDIPTAPEVTDSGFLDDPVPLEHEAAPESAPEATEDEPEPEATPDEVEPEAPALDLLGDDTQPLYSEVAKGTPLGTFPEAEWLAKFLDLATAAADEGDTAAELIKANAVAFKHWLDHGSAATKNALDQAQRRAMGKS